MPEELMKYPDWYDTGSKEPINAGDLDKATLQAGAEIVAWAAQVGNDQALFHGHGSHVRDVAEAFVDLDLVASGNGTGAAGDKIDGDVILAITDSDQRRVLASTTFDSLKQLRDAAAESRSDRPVEQALAPYAKPGRHLEVRVRATSGSDGVEIDPGASSGQLYYTRVTN